MFVFLKWGRSICSGNVVNGFGAYSGCETHCQVCGRALGEAP